MTPTRPRTLIVVAAVCAAVAWLIVRATFATLPRLPWTGVIAMAVLAVAEAWTGRNLRARILGRRKGKPLAPIAVARMVALAKASSLGAAIFGGLAAGLLIYTAGSLNKTVPRADAITAAITIGSAVALIAAALYLEHSLRSPDQPDDHEEPSGSGYPTSSHGDWL
jgi:uncharacterized membrane protein YbhN (UPF0104 family)